MKLNPFVSALVIAAGMTAPTVLFGAAADLNSCCTPADKDMPKSGGNLGNQSYSSLDQVNRSNINMLGPVWKTSTSGAGRDAAGRPAGQRRHRPADDADRRRRRHLRRHPDRRRHRGRRRHRRRASGSGNRRRPTARASARPAPAAASRSVTARSTRWPAAIASSPSTRTPVPQVWAVAAHRRRRRKTLGNIAKVATIYHDGIVYRRHQRRQPQCSRSR